MVKKEVFEWIRIDRKLSSSERLDLRVHLPLSVYFRSPLHYVQKHGSPFIHLDSQLSTTTMRSTQQRAEKNNQLKPLP